MQHSLFAGDGPTRAALDAHDWASHPLGMPETWPSALKVALRLMLSAPESMYIAWGQELHFFHNDSYAPILGPRLAMGVGSTLPSLWADAWEQVKPMVNDALAGRASRFENIPFQLARHGVPESTWWTFFYTPLFNEDGGIEGVFCVTNETTEVMKKARALMSLEAQHRSLHEDVERKVTERALERSRTWQVTADLLAVSSTGDYFESTNPAWQRLLGWDADQLGAMAYPAFVHPEDVSTTHQAFVKARGGEPIARLENRLRTVDGRYRWFSWSIVEEDGRLYCSGRDITDEKTQARALESAEEQLRQAQKMEAVGQLTGGIAHDFNNLLGGILGAIEVVQMRMEQGRLHDIERFLDGAASATRRAAALTHRLLAFSRRQTLDPKPTDINRLVSDMRELIQRSIGPAIRLEIVGDPDLHRVFADPNQIDNALLNLCINARDAMPDGGIITVETNNRTIDARMAEDRGIAPGPYVCLCVSDTGTGMPPEVAARAFDPFFTTKPIGQGTGLGLSMIYGFARQSDGDVRIHSEQDGGTTVCLYLPRHVGAQDMATPALPSVVVHRGSGRGESILVVDDEPSIRLLVVDVLEGLGYAVLEAKDGASAMKILDSNAEVDLLVTDVGLPGAFNGRQVADAARVRRPALKVMFITGYAENAVISHGHLDPGMQVLTKPFSLSDLTHRVRNMLAPE